MTTLSKDLTPQQEALAVHMSELSEEAYCAGWHIGLEYALWDLVNGKADSFGMLALTEREATRLRELSDACGGWIMWDDERCETFVPLEEWKIHVVDKRLAGDE